MQKDIIVKISPILQRQKMPERIRIRLENHFPQLKTAKKIFLNRKPFKKNETSRKQFFRNFS